MQFAIQSGENHRSGGDGGFLSHVEIDTAHFKGNFPESCELRAINSSDLVPYHHQEIPETKDGSPWVIVLPRTKLGPHRRHFFQLQNVGQIKYTHVMLTIYPDGGVKRLRVTGTRGVGTSPQSGIPVSNQGEETPTVGNVHGESRRGGEGVRIVRLYCVQETEAERLVVGR